MAVHSSTYCLRCAPSIEAYSWSDGAKRQPTSEPRIWGGSVGPAGAVRTRDPSAFWAAREPARIIAQPKSWSIVRPPLPLHSLYQGGPAGLKNEKGNVAV